jgi:GWxTD domain-containing protein
MAAVIDILIKPSVVLMGTAILSLMLRRVSASTRHAIWLLAIVSAALLPVVEVIGPKWELPLMSQSENVVLSPSAAPVPVLTVDDAVRTEPLTPGSHSSAIVRSETVIAMVWATGILVALLRFAGGIRAARRLVASAETMDDEEWLSLANQLRTELGISSEVRLTVSDQCVSPMTSGLTRSVILLPAGAREWTEERRRLVLAHELAHVKRRDRWIQILIQCASSVYWFNPLFAYASASLRSERERACDDRVLQLGADPYVYADQLVQVARMVSPNRALSFAAITMSNGVQLESRVRAILDGGRRRRPLSGAVLASISLATALLIVLVTCIRLTAVPVLVLRAPQLALPSESATSLVASRTVSPRPAALPAARQQIAPVDPKWMLRQAVPPQVEHKWLDEDVAYILTQSEKVYQKWLTEDVVYIITNAEKEAFIRLTTDEERNRFIEQFWTRRDKEGHYERIAYANQRFAWGGAPGWKTDRARIYIQFGKPDEIDSHPAGSSSATYPYEVWTYRYLPNNGSNIRFEFDDPAGTGEYRRGPTQAEHPSWMGVWSRSYSQSKSRVDGNGQPVPDPFYIALLRLNPGPLGVTILCEILAPASNYAGPMQTVIQLNFGQTFSRSEFPNVPQGIIKSFQFDRIDDESFQMTYKAVFNGLEQMGTGIAKVSNDGNTLTITNSLWPDAISVYDRQK